MRATIRKKETKPQTKQTDVMKLIAILKSDKVFVWTYKTLCKRLNLKPNQLRAVVDNARNYEPIMTYQKVGYKICRTQKEKDAYIKHIENQIKHKQKHLVVCKGV